MRAKFFGSLLIATLSLVAGYSQSPTPIVVQAASPITTKVVGVPAVAGNDTTAANLKVLRELKAANDVILQKQKTALETIEELQKIADQMKVYTKRT